MPLDRIDADFEAFAAWESKQARDVDFAEVLDTVVERFGVSATAWLVEVEALGEVVAGSTGTDVLAWSAYVLQHADALEAAGDVEQAAEARRLARVAFRDARRGEASAELIARQYDFGDGFPMREVGDYDEACEKHGGVELADLIDVIRPSRRRIATPTLRRLSRPRASRVGPRRGRSRERRRASRAGPVRRRDDEPDLEAAA